MRAPRFFAKKNNNEFYESNQKAIKLPDGREITIETGKL